MMFKSKIDLWVHLSFALMIGLMVFIIFHANSHSSMLSWIIGIVLMLINATVVIPAWTNTCYILAESSLIIKSGLSRPFEIPYENITSIHKSKGSFKMAQSALSIDRLEIIFKNGLMVDYFFVSPENKEKFHYHLSQKIELETSETIDRRFS